MWNVKLKWVTCCMGYKSIRIYNTWFFSFYFPFFFLFGRHAQLSNVEHVWDLNHRSRYKKRQSLYIHTKSILYEWHTYAASGLCIYEWIRQSDVYTKGKLVFLFVFLFFLNISIFKMICIARHSSNNTLCIYFFDVIGGEVGSL